MSSAADTTALRSAAPASSPAKKPRDLRLDFFRGIAMFIILFAHIPRNWWTLWIPARFGFSDATEIFVFCSGMASAMAFGVLFAKRSFWLGCGRIAYRIWQVYWCHIGILLVTAMIGYAIQTHGLGDPEVNYIHRPYLQPMFDRTGDAIIGALTLTYVPGLFDILPMYLVILALVPLVMLAHRHGGRTGVAVFVIGLYIAAQFAGLARQSGEQDWGGTGRAVADWAAGTGLFSWLNLRGRPWDVATWFFNPFAWQLIFFTGFAFGMRWLPAPPRARWLLYLAIAVVVLSVPFAWYKLYGYLTGYLPKELGGGFLWEMRQAIEPFRWKTWQGVFRFTHFLSLAYIAWYWAGPGGETLTRALRASVKDAGFWRLWSSVAGGVAVLTIPYAYVEEIRDFLPVLDAFLLRTVPLVHGQWIGLLQIAHLIALGFVIWAALGPGGRARMLGPVFLAIVPVIRKVGTQSLAVFVVSIPLAVTLGWVLDIIGREMVTLALVNLSGAGLLILTAYVAGWFRREPWRAPPKPASRPVTNAAPSEEDGARAEALSGSRPMAGPAPA
ncbi:MAG: OpgC domain-containing protein [Pseudomonadota bacterium]